MMHLNVFHKSLFTAATLFALFLGGCSGEHEADQSQPDRKQEVELAYVEWSSEVASTNVVRAVLEQLGYQVKITPVSAAAMWQAVGAGDADAMVAAWLPTTHGHYLDKVRDQVVDLGANLDGTKIGLVVPEYVSIDSISQLNDISDEIDGKIIGIDPGAGLMSKTEKVISEYGLDLDLVEGSGATMTAALGDAIKNHAWIVVTGWTPHWMFARWDLKYLDDPKGIYGGAEQIHTIVRQGLESDMPEVYAVLDRFHWTPDDMAELMVWNQEEGADPYVNARRWISEHPDKVAEWTGKQPSM
jgi:glycine betaine/proline transport system substrate-binding protein